MQIQSRFLVDFIGSRDLSDLGADEVDYIYDCVDIVLKDIERAKRNVPVQLP